MKPRPTVVAIVDDDPRLLESLGDLLESAGYAVRAFFSGSSFLEQACLADIDCLVTDIGMPGMDGYRLHRLVTGDRPDLPVFFITGNADWMAAARAAGFATSRHFQKPFDSQALIASISEAVRPNLD